MNLYSSKRKSKVGRMGNRQWIFGGIERESKKCFLEPVANRSSKTLMEIIRRRIRPGSRIISDVG
jgi:hypothetical protein